MEVEWPYAVETVMFKVDTLAYEEFYPVVERVGHVQCS